jgi:integrase
MAVIKLNKRVVEGLEPREKAYIVYDQDLKGFGIRVMPSGVKTWLIEYRPAGGYRGIAKKRMSLGNIHTVNADEARKVAKDKLAAIRLGDDPLAQRAQERAAVPLHDLAVQFLKLHVEAKRKTNTNALYSHILYKHVLPKLGRHKAVDIQKADLNRLHHSLRDTPYIANRMLGVMGALYVWASRHDMLPEGHNPTRGIELYPEHKRERFLTSEELERLGTTLKQAETTGLPWEPDMESPYSKHAPKPENRFTVVSPFATAAIRLLLFTGARLREILHLKWDYIDFERGLLLLPESKTGKKTIVLNAPALAILNELPRVSPYVIAGDNLERPRADLKRPWTLVCKHAGLDGLRIHDLRHTYASFGAGSGMGLPILGRLLGHTQTSTTERYAHLDADPLRRASDHIGSTIAASLMGKPSKNVINLKKG